jgi:hypothetical protein
MSIIWEEEPGDAPQGPRDFAAIGRAAKAAKMIETAEAFFIEAGLDPYSDAEKIARALSAFTDENWLDLQTAAGVQLKLPAHRRKPPGPVTRQLVTEAFEQRATSAAHLEDG